MSTIAKQLKRIPWPLFVLLSIAFTFTDCQQLKVPSQKLTQFNINASHVSYKYNDQLLTVKLANPLQCPLRFKVRQRSDQDTPFFQPLNTVVLPALSDTTLYIRMSEAAQPKLSCDILLGDTQEKVTLSALALPLAINRPSRIVQGYEGTHSHNSDFSRYAIDFAMDIGDTIYAAADGVVVGIIEDYRYGGIEDKWKGYDNFITLYHPETGLYTQYAHLKYKGSLIEIGDTVSQHMPIALAGMTGYTDIAHLHFNALVPVESSEGLKSIPIDFENGLSGKSLKRDDIVERKDD